VYEIDRKEQQVIIRKNGHSVYVADLTSHIIYTNPNGGMIVSQVKDLPNESLLLALATAVEIKENN
jgi:hypothetical protein